MGLTELIPRIMEIWNHERERVTDSSEKITEALAEMKPSAETGDVPDSGRLARLAHGALGSMFDTDSGGFGKAPKFPSAQNILFLLQYAWRHDSADARDMAVKTLRAMRRGGIWDHVGFGFHRYSTDKHWLLPHFEKMLYDQAMLSMAYIEAYQASGDPEFAETARRIFTYVLRDLRDPQGGFHTAEDADSEGEEGLFHTWTTAEIGEVLSPQETERFCEHYGIRTGGNFRDEATRQYTSRNIPNELESGKPAPPDVDALRERLFEAREKRPRPHLDDKVLTDMNGLMIAALARGARVLGESDCLIAAREAADFILGTLREEDGRVRHGYRDGHLNAPGTLDDHAFFLWGLSELYEASFDPRYLEHAESIAEA
nr:hypothetical protein [Salidesulfovibrio brasiliensis]